MDSLHCKEATQRLRVDTELSHGTRAFKRFGNVYVGRDDSTHELSAKFAKPAPVESTHELPAKSAKPAPDKTNREISANEQ